MNHNPKARVKTLGIAKEEEIQTQSSAGKVMLTVF
jgi:hypothetical protein